MANRRVGGIISLKIDGEIYSAKGSFTYNLGVNKKEMILGSGEVAGYKETPQVAYIEGAVTDNSELDSEALRSVNGATITLELANGKVIVIEEAVEASDGSGTTEEGELEVRFEGMRGREVKSA